MDKNMKILLSLCRFYLRTLTTTMKKVKIFRIILIPGMILVNAVTVNAQAEKKPKLSTGADLVSSYVWRGTRYGTGPAVQPSIEVSSGFFSAGAWGSFDFGGYQESDLWFSLSLPGGLSAGMTDYYYPGLDYFDYSGNTGSHAFEVNLGFSRWGLDLNAGYVINRAGNAGSAGNDKYFEAKYSFSNFFLLAGAGDGWHTTDSETGQNRFRFCNIGIGVLKEIKVTDSFGIPVSGQLVFNPDRKTMFIVAGLSLHN